MQFKLNPEVIIRAEEEAAMLFQRRIADTMLISLEGLEVLIGHFKKGEQIPNEFLYSLITKGYVIPSKKKNASKDDLSFLEEIYETAITRKSPLNSLYSPETIHFSLTNACNQKCIGCFYSKGEVEEEKYIDPNIFKNIAMKSKELKIFQYALGGGEPLLHDDIIEFCYLSTENNVIPNITTNGNLFTEKMGREFKAAELGQIQFSLNGSEPKINEKTRPNYKKTLDAINTAKKVGLRWGINFLVTKSNMHDTPKMINLANNLGAETLNFLRVKPPIVKGSTWVQDESLSSEEHRNLFQMISNVSSITKLTVDASFCFLFNNLSSEEMYSRGMWGCAAAQRFCTISPEGHVLACSHMDHHWDVGNGDFEKAWKESKVFQKFRELNQTVKGPCAACSIKETCKGCRAIVELVCDDFLATDPQCPKLI